MWPSDPLPGAPGCAGLAPSPAFPGRRSSHIYPVTLTPGPAPWSGGHRAGCSHALATERVAAGKLGAVGTGRADRSPLGLRLGPRTCLRRRDYLPGFPSGLRGVSTQRPVLGHTRPLGEPRPDCTRRPWRARGARADIEVASGLPGAPPSAPRFKFCRRHRPVSKYSPAPRTCTRESSGGTHVSL